MTVIETVKETLGLGEKPCMSLTHLHSRLIHPPIVADIKYQPVATREQMSEARLPLQYRDSCAHLLIPLNRCRYEEYYLPWKCVVRLVR